MISGWAETLEQKHGGHDQGAYVDVILSDANRKARENARVNLAAMDSLAR